jgi:type IV secretion system protein TrbI
MAGLAAGLLLIILLTGKPAPTRPTPATSTPPAANADRFSDYQQRLRALDARSRQEAVTEPAETAPPPPLDERAGSPVADPLQEARRRREYESLFATNLVLSRRGDGQRPLTGGAVPDAARPVHAAPEPPAAPPSLDDVAAAVLRASRAAERPNASAGAPSGDAREGTDARETTSASKSISPSGPLHLLREGTVIEATLTTRLDGAASSPVACLVTSPVYSHDGDHVLIPAGARVLGTTRPVQAFGETRLAVTFHRLVLPDGSAHALNQFAALNQAGDAGLRDRVLPLVEN